MKSYEGVFIFPPESTPDARQKELKGLDDVLKKIDARVIEKNEWGKKPLGYPVKKFREGHFVVAVFQADPAQMTDFRKALELQEGLIKFMITVKEEKRAKVVAEKSSRPAVAVKPSQQPAASH